MLDKQIYREKLGMPIKICMACASKLETDHALKYGLCRKHWEQIIQTPPNLCREFGRGTEYQLLPHTDELDDILFRLEYEREPAIILENEPMELFLNYLPPKGEWPARPHFLIYAHYIARIFYKLLCQHLDLSTFDFITFADSYYTTIEFIFSEMGYLAKEQPYAKLFLFDDLHYLLQEQDTIPEVANQRILLLDLYRSYDTRQCIDRLKLSGAEEVVTAYLTSYS